MACTGAPVELGPHAHEPERGEGIDEGGAQGTKGGAAFTGQRHQLIPTPCAFLVGRPCMRCSLFYGPPPLLHCRPSRFLSCPALRNETRGHAVMSLRRGVSELQVPRCPWNTDDLDVMTSLSISTHTIICCLALREFGGRED